MDGFFSPSYQADELPPFMLHDEMMYGGEEDYDYFYDEDNHNEPPQNAYQWIQRFLKKEASKGRMDYSVLSVGVMTLGLILAVEVGRHKLDHSAMGRPYMTAVLENIYAELTTLGIVEFFVFLLQRYHTSMNKAKKDVFGDIHFALFYTAILNAFQSVILAFITTRVSQKIWVQTEALELNHYVEVREEFERVQALLCKNRGKDDNVKNAGGNSFTSSDDPVAGKDEHTSRSRSPIGYHAEYGFDASWKGIRAMWGNLVDLIRRPVLTRRYNNLLMQVRFHELRVHFLKSYNLPPKLKVSDYLIRCEMKVLIKLVHVSAVAWLLLTATFNVLYYVLGIVGYFKESPSLVGTSMIYIFFFSLGLFVILALLLFNKMKSIFAIIMHRAELWETVADEDEQRRLSKQQMGLFWAGSPKLVIAAIQFMQFGYAVALAGSIMFIDTISDGSVSTGWYFIAIVLCYLSFVGVAAHVIPRYTLCTSLAQLVDKKRLNETVANYHLEEAKKQRLAEQYFHAYNQQHPDHMPQQKELSSMRPGQLSNETIPSTVSSITSANDSSSGRNAEELTIADLVGVDTGTLRSRLPEDDGALMNKRDVRKERRRRMKAVSDGVALMASMKPKISSEEEKTDIEGTSVSAAVAPPSASRPRRRDRRKSVSDGVAAMAALTGGTATSNRGSFQQGDSERIADLVKLDTNSLREQLSPEERKKLEARQSLRQSSGSRRKKANSDPNAMAQMTDGASDEVAGERKKRAKVPSDGVQAMSNFVASLNFLGPKKSEPSGSKAKDMPPPNIVVGATEEEEEFDDNMSDVGDIPDVDFSRLNEFRRVQEEREQKASFKEQLKEYYLSKRFPVVSNVFGTMVVFFLFGSRVERFLHTQNIVPKDFISFDFSQVATFWINSCLLWFFMITQCLVFWAVGRNNTGIKYRKVFLATAMDAVLVGSVFIIFWTAEAKRCCTPSSGETITYDSYSPHPCDCPMFGSRLYGGLGRIEPWTSLIALRLFRFYIAKRIIKFQDRKRGILPTPAEEEAELADENNLDPFDVHNVQKVKEEAHENGHGHEHGGGHGDDHGHGHDRGTATELWELAVGQHPDIVEKYGMFSAEMLQVMLGLPLKPEVPKLEEIPQETTYSSSEGSHMPSDDEDQAKPDRRSNFMLDQRYSTLSLGAQEIIMQGKLGQKVQSVSAYDAVPSAIPEDHVAQQQAQPAVFKIADDATAAVSLDFDQQLPFDAPNARLVRSMRRCDRKLVPMLNKWVPVDVVITRFEIVYFDASDSLGDHTLDATLQAIKATKGGKGLRLKDVAEGRRCVGHLPLSEIKSLAIERYMPSEEHHDDGPDDMIPETEFWKNDTMHFSRKEAWSKIKQDTVAVHTAHGNTLYLRFYSDLEDAESHPERAEDENDEEGPISRNNAFQWIQTLGRFCGPEQLHQDLPHFGEDNDDELRDYLIVHQAGELKRHVMFLAHQGGNLRLHNQETVGAMSKRVNQRASTVFPRNIMKRPSGRSSQIFGSGIIPEGLEDEGDLEVNTSKRGLFHRSASVGDGLAEMGTSDTPAKGQGAFFRRSHSLGEDNQKPAATKSKPDSPLPVVEEAVPHVEANLHQNEKDMQEQDDSPV